MNAINNINRKDDIKKEDDEIVDVSHSYVGDEYKDLIEIFLNLNEEMNISILV